MNNYIYGWLKNLHINGTLPTANCELLISKQIIFAITSADIARKSQIVSGLAQFQLTHDIMGNHIVCNIEPILSQCNEQQYLNLTSMINNTNEHLIARFFKLLSLVTCSELQSFIDFILTKQSILQKFIQAPASLNHHHSYTHGLFEHSIEVAEIAFNNAKHLNHSSIECQAALVAGLFHDIGKIFVMLHQASDRYIPGPHEGYNFAILAEPLAKLGSCNRQLLELLSCLLAAKPSGYKARYAIEHIVQQADRCSSESAFIHAKFQELPDYYHFCKVGDKVLKRIS